MALPPWMPFYPADYLASTGHLTCAQHGAYLLLILHYWSKGGLPSDERQLARIARMTGREWRASRNVLAAFFDDEWRHERIEKELEKAIAKTAKRAIAGSRGGTAKSLKSRGSPVANASDLLQQNGAFALASSSQPQKNKSLSAEPLPVISCEPGGEEPQRAASETIGDFMERYQAWERRRLATEGCVRDVARHLRRLDR